MVQYCHPEFGCAVFPPFLSSCFPCRSIDGAIKLGSNMDLETNITIVAVKCNCIVSISTASNHAVVNKVPNPLADPVPYGRALQTRWL